MTRYLLTALFLFGLLPCGATERETHPFRQPGMCAKEEMAADGIVRLSKIEVYPEFLDEYVKYATEVGEISLRTEPGVLTMYAVGEKENPCKITILETYASREAYDKHIASAHFRKYKQGTLHMVKSLVLSDQTPLNPTNRINNFIVNDNNQNKTNMESNTIKLTIEGGKTFTATTYRRNSYCVISFTGRNPYPWRIMK